MGKAKVLIINGYGINCDVETGWAFEMAGADEVVHSHVNRLVKGERRIQDFNIMVFPGGFSFGDHISSGKVLAFKIRTELGEQIEEFVKAGKLVLGICNGFQVMVKMGLLPGKNGSVFAQQTVTLTHNDSATYEDRWVHLKVNPDNPSPFLTGIDRMFLPVRHGEGKFVGFDNEVSRLEMNNMIAMQYTDPDGNLTNDYPYNPNGSELAIAAITNKEGNVLGMMPHPEVYVVETHHPYWTALRPGEKEKPHGIRIFENAVSYAKKHLS